MKTIQGFLNIVQENPDLTTSFLGVNDSVKESCTSLESLGLPTEMEKIAKRICIVREEVEFIIKDLTKIKLS